MGFYRISCALFVLVRKNIIPSACFSQRSVPGSVNPLEGTLFFKQYEVSPAGFRPRKLSLSRAQIPRRSEVLEISGTSRLSRLKREVL